MVDVDGVISLFGFDPATPPAGRFQLVDGIAHLLSATAGDHLRQLSDEFELVWCTGWEERANEHLVPALGLPWQLPHLTFTDPPGVAPRHWKLEAIERRAGPRRPLAWIDDDHTDCQEWALRRPGPTLLVTTVPARGITEEQVELLISWAANPAG
jgi:hypothetical protein